MSLFPRRTADPKFRKSASNKEKSVSPEAWGWAKPHVRPPDGLSWVTTSGDSGNLRWSTLLAKAVQVRSHRHRSQTPTRGGRGLEGHLCTNHMPVPGDCAQRSVVRIWVMHTAPVDTY